MTFKEFLHLNEDAFRLKIRGMKDEELAEILTHNRRARHGGKYGMVSGATLGVSAAIPTFGVSLIGVPLGARRHDVAKRRMVMVLEEYARRGLLPHDERKRDRGIPAAATAFGAALTFGVFTGGEAMVVPLMEHGHWAAAEVVMDVTQGAAGAAAQQVTNMGGEQAVEGPMKDSGSTRSGGGKR